jgi:Holliday junction resolvasome RuvABC DNA-binding subunit
MSGKLGPKFALALKAHGAWSQYVAHAETSMVLLNESQEAFCLDIPSESFRQKLKNSEDYVWVFIAQIIREDEEVWFGFSSPQERLIFEQLKEIPGIGPKTTASLIGGLGLSSLRQLLLGENPALFKVAGVGPKTMLKVAQGLQNDKDRYLKLLSHERSSASPSNSNKKIKDSDDQNLSEPKNIEDYEDNSVSLSSAVIKAMERLGLRLEEVLELYKEILKEKNLAHVSEAEMIKLLIQQWGLWRSRSRGELNR